MLEKIEGIILKTIDYGETNKIITIFSKNIGKFTAMARGAKKPRSRMAAVTQPFIAGQFFVYINPGLSTIRQGEILESFRPLREDIEKTAYTAYLIELSEKLLDDKTPEPYLYDQLYRTMEWIAEHDEYDIPILMYELKIFQKGGFAPTLSHCSNCGNKEGPYAFSIGEGGLLCRRCLSLDDQAVQLTEIQVKLLQMFQAVGIEQVGEISVKLENRQLFRRLLDAYYDRFGGYFLKSRRFLNQLDQFKG
ncbi:DNA repair protein RecO [Oceanobacillus sp. AG]|uniref:DNA repair protein RecO n=1 Tax=Oceanobacillus sp. AG TaxID=2681969 RepID=UPI0012EC9772|nr:DNA repair protein RecO [Oceanobacillus sp. AG]